MWRISRALAGFLCVGMGALVISPSLLAQDNDSILKSLHKISTIASTLPSNQDVNPYGVALVKRTVGNLTEGHVLVSNFNNFSNLQGTGTTIVEIAPNGSLTLFAQIDPTSLPGPCPGGVGLTTALAVLRSGWVIVGSLPTSDGTSATAQAGCLIVLDSSGKPVETIYGSLINGPWDMAAFDGGDEASLFVTNVLNGTVAAGGETVNRGTVVRLLLADIGPRPIVVEDAVISSGFPERTDPAALVIGPTGLAFDSRTGTLYVADSLDNRIAAIPNALFRFFTAGTGITVSSGGSLNDPLGLTIAPNHDLIAANGNDGNLVEVNPSTGQQVATKLVDSSGSPPGAGALFGLVATPAGVYFVDDATNTFNLLH